MTHVDTQERYFAQAINDGFRQAMTEDDRVFIIGEDVELSTVGATKDLVGTFGKERIRNSPISEPTVVGSCIGAAATGLRPVMDAMFSSFFYIAMDQIANQAARLRYMSGGQVELPLVYFTGTGPSGSAAAQHSENPHPLLMHLAGLKVVFPATPADAKGLLLSAIRDPNPVVYLLDFVLAGTKGPVPTAEYSVPLGEARIAHEGVDATIIAIGSSVQTALLAAEELESEGVSIEVVDVRTLVPFDWDAVTRSVAKTGRAIVVDPARRTCGAAGEIVAGLVERVGEDMKTLPTRVTWPDVPIPFSAVLEEAVTIGLDDVLQAVKRSIETDRTAGAL